jgi:hypothetical protein
MGNVFEDAQFRSDSKQERLVVYLTYSGNGLDAGRFRTADVADI